MSTDLSNKKFPKTAQQGAFSWLFEAARERMRDTAKNVRMTAAWRTWPTIHKIAKALQEGLTTDRDNEQYKHDSMHRLAARMADCYPTPAHFPYPDDPERQQEAVALMVGGGLSKDNSNIWGVTYEDVLALYKAEYTNLESPLAPPDHAAEAAYEKDMDQWGALNAAVGGDLYSDPQKLAVMRQLDREMSDAPWEEFEARVIEAVQDMPQSNAPTAPEIS